jgi:L-alanine-DL-glutamate epimerase-like enolase superfamily enzyme
MVMSMGSIHVITQADVRIRAVTNGRESEGAGCIYLSDLWAWPGSGLSHEIRDAAMRGYCQYLASCLPTITDDAAHPLALGLRLHEAVIAGTPHPAADELKAPDHSSAVPPQLARIVCASPFDAAIHDAAGRALGTSAFNLYAESQPIPQADGYFLQGACRAIQAVLNHPPRTASMAWWIVGKNDDLQKDLQPVVEQFGCFAFKLKIMGQDAHTDARRTVEVAHAARHWGLQHLVLSIDSNEANPDVASVLDYLAQLKRLDQRTYADLLMIEQPTARDIGAHPYDWRAVAVQTPVFLDEGLVSLKTLALAKEQGWSGFALKTCKGHSFTLIAAAWAFQRGLLLSLQDLTNPGLAAVHAGLLAAYMPTINGVELNSQQFTPQANDGWRDQYPDLFTPRDGQLRLPPASLVGLGGGGA